MSLLFKKFRKVVEQCFVPIFVRDSFDTETLLRGCELAGVDALEYTLRREDAHVVIPRLKKRFVDKVVFVGSTIDDEKIVSQMKRKFPQLLTLSQLAPHVDGFVSMLPYSDETLIQYSHSHLLIPSAESSGDALRQMKNGATVIKVCGPELALVKKLHALPTFNYCPTFFTGGATLERMDEVFAAGNILVGSGFDLLLKGEDHTTLTAEHVADRIRMYINAAQTARAKVLPQLKDTADLSDESFIQILPNYVSLANDKREEEHQ